MKQVYIRDLPRLTRDDYLLLRKNPQEFIRLHPELIQIDLEKNEEETYVVKEIKVIIR